MHGIGNVSDATLIRTWVRDSPKRSKWGRPDCVHKGYAPEGWKYLGSGSFRSVWLSPEGVAYKVLHTPEDYDNQQRGELDCLARAWEIELPARCRVPKYQPYVFEGEIITAVERINGKTLDDSYGEDDYDEFATIKSIASRRLGLQDMHGDNCMVDENTRELVLVDLGY